MKALQPTILVGNPEQIRREIRKILAGKRRLARPPRMLFPSPAMRDYRAALLQYSAELRKLAHSHLGPWIHEHAKEIERTRPKKDAADDDLGLWKDLDWIKARIGQRYSRSELVALARKTATSVNTWNKAQEKRMIGKVLGVDVAMEEPWVDSALKGFIGENVMLIESVEDRFYKDIATKVYGAFRNGIRAEDVGSYLDDLVGDSADNADWNAERVARDQIGKLNGKLTESRQTSLGIETYKWRGVLDQRERESHVELEGQEFAWDGDPEPPEGHPGQPILCRCYAEPVFDLGE